MQKRLQTNEPAFLTRKDAAIYLAIAPETFSAWLRRGIIVPTSGTNLFDPKELDEAMDRLSSKLDAWRSNRQALKAREE